jgi:LPS sulfotransferase NodH
MKLNWIFILGIIAAGLSACQQQVQHGNLIEAGQKMQAAMKACIKEELTRENAVEQIDCIAKVKMAAGYAIHNPYMWNLEEDIVADRASAIQYADGKISRCAYIKALEEHWAEALKFDEEERAKSRGVPLIKAEVHLQDLGMI